MFKTLNTLLLMFLLSACSSQEGTTQKENNATPSNQSSIETKAIETNTIETKTNIVENQAVDSNATQAVGINTSKPSISTKESTSSTSLFTLTTIAGKELHIDEAVGGLTVQEYKDKVVLLILFGHRCPPCLAEIPALKALTDKGHKDLEIIALEVQGQAQTQLKAFKKRMGINYHLVTGKDNYDFINYIAEKANWSGSIPFLLGFNKQSEVKVVHMGGVSADQFDNIYETLSKEKAEAEKN